jgi:hypothetical protein
VVTSFNARAAAIATLQHAQQIMGEWGSLGVVGVAMALPVILSMLGLGTRLATA